MITMFLATLELVKVHEIVLEQAEIFGDIYLVRKKMNRLAEIEVLLFVAGEEGLTLRNLAEMLELQPTAVNQQLEKLSENTKLIPIQA